MPPSAYLLISHGSRDPRPQIALEHLAKLVNSRSPAALVGTAVLELALLPLHQQIQQFSQTVLAAGYERLQIVPLFLLPGVHVLEDIPLEVSIAQRALEPYLTLEICPYLGSHADLWQMLLNPVDAATAAAPVGRIVLAHGSRRPTGNQPVETIATHLNALPAYWSVAPNLETQVTEWVRRGCQQIAILPYFLFEGGITDAIEQQVQQLAQQLPYVKLHLSRPFGATGQLADRVVELIRARG